MKSVPIKRTIERIPGGMMIVPLFLGAIVSTLAPNTAKVFGSFTGALFTGALPILAVFYVCTGATIEFNATRYILKKGGDLVNLRTVFKAGLLGLLVGLFVVVVTGTFLFIADRLTGGNGTAGLAAASTAGNAAAVPAIVAAANPAYKPAAEAATVLVATSVVVTAICVPIVTAWWNRRVTRRTARVPPPGAAVASASTR